MINPFKTTVLAFDIQPTCLFGIRLHPGEEYNKHRPEDANYEYEWGFTLVFGPFHLMVGWWHFIEPEDE